MKKVVHYTGILLPPKPGERALVYTTDHPGPDVSNTGPVSTSLVWKVDKDGKGFETENSHYRELS